jgi:enoyl-[acyl-carrier-protein] reductase (NADH)
LAAQETSGRPRASKSPEQIPMTRKNLNAEQVANITNQTPTQNLVSPTNVAKAVSWLASEHSEGVNGQFITIDNGWSKIRAI